MMLRVAFIGAGQMARHHLRAVRALGPQSLVVGVHDTLADRAADMAALAACRPYTSIEGMLEETQPDVVHVCTPPETHFEAARAALAGGAHTYVEKPFARKLSDARALVELASARRLIVCAGHQLLRDPGFERLMGAADTLGDPVQADSHFAFRPARLAINSSSAPMLARELIDILPHPLYALVAVLERLGDTRAGITLDWVHADPTDVQAILRSGSLIGRLSVSLRARPVASSLTLTGTRGALTCDFVRSVVVGAANPGTEPLEKVFNPIFEGMQLATRTAWSVTKRLRHSGAYPGLIETIGAFHRAAANGGPPPLSPGHLLRVTEIFETLATRVDAAAHPCRPHRRPAPRTDGPLTVVTGARGFLGAEVSRRLPRVRGIGRNGWPDWLHVQEWVPTDLGAGVRPEIVANADVVVHLAAETAGGFAEHQRNTIDATRNLLQAMHAAGATRLVLVSSLSVLRPPRTPWERQDEQTPPPADPRAYGPYAWGKTMQEELVLREAPALGIATRIIRPGALVDWRDPSLPGLVGRRLFGGWHLGLGRPGLPVAVCDVGRCADVIAWTARHFDEAPAVLNLFDPSIATRGRLLREFRAHGWNGRMCWVPIRMLATAAGAARTALALARRTRGERLDVYGVLRPRRFDSRHAARALDAADAYVEQTAAPERPPLRAVGA